MTSQRRMGSAAVMALALLLGSTTATLAFDRATDPAGDASPPGIDIVRVTTAVTSNSTRIMGNTLVVGLDFAADYDEPDALLGVLIAERGKPCNGYVVPYAVAMTGRGAASARLSIWHPVQQRVDWPIEATINRHHVAFHIPMALIDSPDVLRFSVYANVREMVRPGGDWFPDEAAGFTDACYEMPLFGSAAKSAAPSAPASAAATGIGGPPAWLIGGAATALAAAVMLLAWRRPAYRPTPSPKDT